MSQLRLYDPDAEGEVVEEAPPLKIHAADDQVPFEQPRPSWACQLAPGLFWHCPGRPAWWFRLWQRAFLGWRWLRRN